MEIKQISDEMIENISFVLRGKNRSKIMLLLVNNTKTPKNLSEKTGIKLSGISFTLKELKEQNLVKCINPEHRKGKKFKLTDLGEETMKLIIDNYSDIGGIEKYV